MQSFYTEFIIFIKTLLPLFVDYVGVINNHFLSHFSPDVQCQLMDLINKFYVYTDKVYYNLELLKIYYDSLN